jgi:hypothetical protein
MKGDGPRYGRWEKMGRTQIDTCATAQRTGGRVVEGFAGAAPKLAISGSSKLVNNGDSLRFLERPGARDELSFNGGW